MRSQQSLAATGLVLLLASTASALPFSLLRRDPPAALPQRAPANDLKFQPAMDFDTDGCYNTPAIGPDGKINPGLPVKGADLTTGCRDLSDLQNNNVYSRARCNNGWCAYLYGYFFEKDVVIPFVPFDGVGHRNDWEHVAVWVKDGVPKYVAASMHGEYEVKAASDVRWDGNHPKIVYHKDGAGSHAFRFANADDDKIENATGRWFYGALVSWFGFPTTELRNKLTAYDFGSATFALRDANYAGNLNIARGSFIPEFDINLDVGSPGNP